MTNYHIRPASCYCIFRCQTLNINVLADCFWPTVLVEPLVLCVVCLSVCLPVCLCLLSLCLWRFVLWRNGRLRSSEKLSEGVKQNRKPGSKPDFCVAAIFLLPVWPLRPPRRPFLPYFARTAQQSVLDSTKWLSSSKPCAYCRNYVVRKETGSSFSHDYWPRKV